MIVLGPDAYISPNWYPSKAEHQQAVPTSNYELVHIRGAVTVHDDPEWKFRLVRDLTDHRERLVDDPDISTCVERRRRTPRLHRDNRQPSCLFVSFFYGTDLSDVGIEDLVTESILHWRTRITGELDEAASTRPSLNDIDLSALADNWFTTCEGPFLLAQAVGHNSAMRRQLTHLRHYLELLFDANAPDPIH